MPTDRRRSPKCKRVNMAFEGALHVSKCPVKGSKHGRPAHQIGACVVQCRMNIGPIRSIFVLLLIARGFTPSLSQSLGEGERALTIDSRYFNPKYSNRALSQFGIDLIHVASLPGALILPVDTSKGAADDRFMFYRSAQLRVHIPRVWPRYACSLGRIQAVFRARLHWI